MTSKEEKEKEDEMYGENGVDATVDTDYENLNPIQSMLDRHMKNDAIAHALPQNPLAEMMKGLTGMLTQQPANRPPQKLTLSGMVGESQINIEITDPFTASMAHDVINRVASDLKLKREADEGKARKNVGGTSEEAMFNINERKRKEEKRKEEEWAKYEASKGVSEEDMFRHLPGSNSKKLTD